MEILGWTVDFRNGAWGPIVGSSVAAALSLTAAIWSARQARRANKALESQRQLGERQLEEQRAQGLRELASHKAELDKALVFANMRSTKVFEILPELWARASKAARTVQDLRSYMMVRGDQIDAVATMLAGSSQYVADNVVFLPKPICAAAVGVFEHLERAVQMFPNLGEIELGQNPQADEALEHHMGGADRHLNELRNAIQAELHQRVE